MNEIVCEVQEAPEGGYTARALGHSIFTEADTFEELREMARDVVRTHFGEDDPRRAVPITLRPESEDRPRA